MKQRTIYSLMAAGGLIGLVASFLQMLEKLTLLKNDNAELVCNLNSVFSCSNVLNAWQSSVFGFPNSMMCMVLFTIFGSVALVGAMGGTVTKALRLAVHGLSLFTFGFGLWFLWQSTYSIGSLCLYCLFCFSGLLLVNWGWVRINQVDLPAWLHIKGAAAKGADTFVWIIIAVTIAFAMLLRFS